MRNYENFDRHYDELLGDVYPQPIDDGHLANMTDVIMRWIAPLNVVSVIDMGCGDGDAKYIFDKLGIQYWGNSLNLDGVDKNLINTYIFKDDFNFVSFVNKDDTIDLVYSRHSLEHSPFPLLTLMEWHRVSNHWLCLVLPNPKHYTYAGRNHYSVMNATHAAWILRRAGWKMRRVSIRKDEMWYLCEKANRIGYEGWAEAPLANKIYEFERDLGNMQGEIDVKQYFESRGWNGLF
jgi:SAM-dependent methyltransferase